MDGGNDGFVAFMDGQNEVGKVLLKLVNKAQGIHAMCAWNAARRNRLLHVCTCAKALAFASQNHHASLTVVLQILKSFHQCNKQAGIQSIQMTWPVHSDFENTFFKVLTDQVGHTTELYVKVS